MDPIAMEVVYRATIQIAKELSLNMLRTGYSSVIKESQDFTFSILDAQGRMVAQGVPQPLHIGGISAQTQEVLRKFKDRMAPGDAYILNHPYQACQNHATDVTIISPVFFRGELAAMVGNTAHKPDLGGKVPGTNSPDATDLMQEGLLIPALRLYRDEKVNQEIKEIIWANTRTPEVTWGDISAQAQTNFYGIKKLTELFESYGKDEVLVCWDRWMDICEQQLREAIEKVPDGVYGPYEDFLDDDSIEFDREFRIAATMTVKGDELFLELESSPQARGPINLRPCVAHYLLTSFISAALCPDLPLNQGVSRPMHITFPPEGTILNPRYPAAVNMYVRPSQILNSVVGMALADAVPEKVGAPDSGAGGSCSFSGRDERSGRWFSLYDICRGGAGARPRADGVSVLDSFVVNVMNTPVEMVEAEFPIRIRRYELHEESGGAGKYRGGMGIRRDWEMLCQEATVNLRSDRFLHSAPGINGGSPAKPSQAWLNPDTSDAKPQRSKVAKLLLRKGDVFSVKYGGGGGRGKPHERPVEQVLEDVWNGYIRKETARQVYGVVVEGWPPKVNEIATRRLRGKP